jgi:hypothetical protein
MVLGFDLSSDGARQALEHPPACTAGDHKIICKGGDILNVQDNNIFSLFVF